MSAVAFARAVRRGDFVRVHPRVYVGHNGPLSWLERAWAAVLWAEPAGLWGTSALRAFHRRDLTARDADPIHVLAGRARHLVAPPGVVVHRSVHATQRVQANLCPPRVRNDDTVVDLAESASDDLSAVAEGTCSVLEHGYLTMVERPHGLPVGRRQVSARRAGRAMWRDVQYEDWGCLVELDGRLGHTAAQDRDRDLDRDLDAAVTQELTTLRLGYGQVFGAGCRTAAKVAAVLNRRGWPGSVLRCPECGAQDQAA